MFYIIIVILLPQWQAFKQPRTCLSTDLWFMALYIVLHTLALFVSINQYSYLVKYCRLCK